MRNLKHLYLILTLVIIGVTTAYGQERDDRATILNFKGIQYKSSDSLFYVNFRFRMQNRLGYKEELNGIDDGKFDARIRRLRMRMDGYIYTPKISYSVQLAFTRSDQDYDDSKIPNIVRDAVMFYNFTDDFYISFGQNKLPGNRQRVNSSGQLQFADRSLVNENFTLDRDFGVSLNLSKKIGNVPINAKAAISTGEGRAASSTDAGLAYTGRVEFLPLGDFTNDNDYQEGDLEREETPKLSIGGGYSYNDRTKREAGQLGRFVQNPFTFKIAFADAIFKYAGFAYQAEYMRRDVDNPFNITDEDDPQETVAYKGWGVNQQVSYLLNHGYEIAGRYTYVEPHKDIQAFERQTEVMEVGLTKYMKAHRLKFQLNGSYTFKDGYFNNNNDKSAWGAMFQVELGI
ncbi:OprO/OprP family phosphate-selective porin [Sphingobacterium daejeonense]|uniref:OprO/OprP family phosphate-selective porin n=1 Tax=Sphingobacterium daejeonense TaxID=371142 RepID=UPI0021A9726D|nr:OprO/OprP family phosphate-selective porin [Sphingobacterium daejeonense]MCT1532716.1 OprO/OprP family phosphate-selective porin [Sphingobacterium daejeonense]